MKCYHKTFMPANRNRIMNPIDMFRYDTCWLADQISVYRFINLRRHVDDEDLRITVAKFAEKENWSIDRWKSFGWVPVK